MNFILILTFSILSTAASISSKQDLATKYEINDWALDRITSGRNYSGWNPDVPHSMYWCNTRVSTPLIFIVDNGFRSSHVEFERRLNFLEGEEYPQSLNGTATGSKIIGKTLGLAKNSQLTAFPLKTSEGIFWDNPKVVIDHIKKLRESTDQPIILNLSMGLRRRPCNYLNELTALNVIIVMSAGNNWKATDGSEPCTADDVIIVGATGLSTRYGIPDVLAHFSEFESKVDLYAPGDNVKVASNTSNSAYAFDSGTSLAAPLVTGLVAGLLEQKPNATTLEVQEQLVRMSAKDIILGLPRGHSNRLMLVDLSTPEAACNLWAQQEGRYSAL